MLFLSLGLYSSLEAAVVVKKFRKKKNHLVRIDTGKLNGFVKGIRICFYNDKGKKRGCGKIVRSKNNSSIVKVSKKTYRRIKVAMEAQPDEAGTVAGAVSSSSSGGINSNFKAFYAFTPVTVTKYNKVSYEAPPATSDPVSTLWAKSEDSGPQQIGAGMEVEFGFNQSFSLAVGFRFKLFREFIVDSDYSTTNDVLYAATNIKGTSIGFWTDFYYLNMQLSPGFYLRMPAGLDFEKTDVTSISDRLVDDGSEDEFNIVDAKSSVTVVSVRAGAHFAYVINPIGFSFGLNLFIPATTLSSSISGSTFPDPNEARLESADIIDDLDTSLELGANSFGAEILISTFIVF